MKTIHTYSLAKSIAFPCILSLVGLTVTGPISTLDFHASIDGSAQANGSLTKPYGSVADAVEAVRALRNASNTEPEAIKLREGRHQLNETLVLRLKNGWPAAWAEKTLPQHGVGDPLFVDPAGGDLSFNEGSPALKLRIGPLDVSKMGGLDDTAHGPDHYPEFSWDTIPLYMHMRKATSFTQDELNYLAGFPLITLEKTTGSESYGSSEAGSREAAKAIKAVNPNAKVLYYRNVMCNYGSYNVNDGLKDIPGAFLRARNGNTKLHRGVREVYDLSDPDLRKWWVDHCVEMAKHDEIDGLFLDGNIKALEPAFLGRELGADRKQEVAEGYAVMMQDLKNRIPSDKLLVANIIRARLPQSGLDYLQYFDGSYLEGIESESNGLTRLEYLTKGIAAIQQAARDEKIICMSMGLGQAASRGLRIDDSRQRLAPGANTQSRLEYCLALFLICAEKYSYVFPHDGYDVNNNRSSIWLKRFAEYDKPLGPPQGPATKRGYTYTRDFEHASVLLDIEKEEAKITWSK